MNIFNEYFHDQYVYSVRGIQQSSDCVIFIHGFPGNVSKNEDLAEDIAQKFFVDAYAVHFGGLGKGTGKFAFGQSYSTALNFVLEMSRRYKRVHLVGHSFARTLSRSSSSIVPRR
jgi:pimeloyl-ACP methyl ester carboxylesterase